MINSQLSLFFLQIIGPFVVKSNHFFIIIVLIVNILELSLINYVILIKQQQLIKISMESNPSNNKNYVQVLKPGCFILHKHPQQYLNNSSKSLQEQHLTSSKIALNKLQCHKNKDEAYMCLKYQCDFIIACINFALSNVESMGLDEEYEDEGGVYAFMQVVRRRYAENINKRQMGVEYLYGRYEVLKSMYQFYMHLECEHNIFLQFTSDRLDCFDSQKKEIQYVEDFPQRCICGIVFNPCGVVSNLQHTTKQQYVIILYAKQYDQNYKKYVFTTLQMCQYSQIMKFQNKNEVYYHIESTNINNIIVLFDAILYKHDQEQQGLISVKFIDQVLLQLNSKSKEEKNIYKDKIDCIIQQEMGWLPYDYAKYWQSQQIIKPTIGEVTEYLNKSKREEIHSIIK